jgi:ATPase subunit of ABC transporter with duplicated ATPase domains
MFGGRKLFSDVNLEFNKGNCYGVIGANGAGKTTFLKILTGEIETTAGEVWLDPHCRLSILSQNQHAFDQYSVLETVMMGHKRLVEVIHEKNRLYESAEFTDEIGMRIGELEAEFAELDGWNAENNAEILLTGLGIRTEDSQKPMKTYDAKKKVKILLAQALFGNPEVLLLDEPTNNLDPISVRWLETFLMNYENCVLVVSHDRHFLNDVCTHICDVEYGRISLYPGNYDFWYESSQLALRQEIGDEDQGTRGFHPPVQRQQIEGEAGDLPQESARQDRPERHQTVAPPLSLHRFSTHPRRRKRNSDGR